MLWKGTSASMYIIHIIHIVSTCNFAYSGSLENFHSDPVPTWKGGRECVNRTPNSRRLMETLWSLWHLWNLFVKSEWVRPHRRFSMRKHISETGLTATKPPLQQVEAQQQQPQWSQWAPSPIAPSSSWKLTILDLISCSDSTQMSSSLSGDVGKIVCLHHQPWKVKQRD